MTGMLISAALSEAGVRGRRYRRREGLPSDQGGDSPAAQEAQVDERERLTQEYLEKGLPQEAAEYFATLETLESDVRIIDEDGTDRPDVPYASE